MKYYIHLVDGDLKIEVDDATFNEIRDHLAHGPDTSGGQRSFSAPISGGKKKIWFPLRSVAYIEEVEE